MDTGSNGSALAVVEPSSSMDANVGVLMRRASDVAGVCKQIVLATAQTIQGRKYVKVEGWQSIAVAYGLVASARDVSDVYDNGGHLIGIKAIGEVRRMSDGFVVSSAEGFVGEDEPVWAGGGHNTKTNKPYERRPDYARRAMAQTRAISRACRSALAFVVTLIDANLSTTPAEEMDGVERGSETPPAPQSGSQGLKAKMKPTPPGAAPRNEPPPHTDADFREDDSPESQNAPAQHDRNVSFRFGKDKGTPLHSLSEASLCWYAQCLENDIKDAAKASFMAANKLALENVRAEMTFRGLS